jgi:hypothetical protein
LNDATLGSPVLRSPATSYFSDLGKKSVWLAGWENFLTDYKGYLQEEVIPPQSVVSVEREVQNYFFDNFDLFLVSDQKPGWHWLKEKLPEGVANRIYRENKYFVMFPEERAALGFERPRWWSQGLIPALWQSGFLFATQLIYRELKNGVTKYQEAYLPEGIYPFAYLTSGGRSNVYLIRIEGKLYVLKIPLNSRTMNGVNRRDNFFFHWLQERSPEGYFARLMAYDPMGTWTLTEYVEGMTLAEILVKKSGDWTKERYQSLSHLFSYAKSIYEKIGIVLDLSPFNIVFEGTRAVLVDVGPVPWNYEKHKLFQKPLKEVLEEWRKNTLVSLSNQRISNCVMELFGMGDPAIREKYRERVQQIPFLYRRNQLLPALMDKNHRWSDLPAGAIIAYP